MSETHISWRNLSGSLVCQIIYGIPGETVTRATSEFQVLCRHEYLKSEARRTMSIPGEPGLLHLMMATQSTWPSEEAVRKFANTFDDIFFLGRLKGRVRVDLRNACLTSSNGRALGWCITQRSKRDRAYDRAFIRIYDEHETQSFWTRLARILATLLHEMIHAYLRLYGCASDPCQNCSLNNGALEIGAGGHGLSFIRICRAIKQSSFLRNLDSMLYSYGSEAMIGDARALEPRLPSIALPAAG